ncbi:ethylene-responsive transcription factor ERF039 [Brachypodium distachyon]|uniref:AP2/ERF domain-containing protein n=1 Tax=Brachypodium distachyon TaxID=15368 RepID=I1J0C1_BRADI|nr:ethylene-responsive transcription factor ERF039 [Brachypodium distachyon]KQJ83930.1 hypothetical protein BRADI_5g17630v3 [Brachypodium distachyon]|eukprot:XP_003581499.1 ethylene-responsive transcription factor ERF039 [Brachypodium distachyon]
MKDTHKPRSRTSPAATFSSSSALSPPSGGANKRPRKEGRHSTYHGVRMRNWGRWVSEIREPRKKSRIWLGTFGSAEKAARAHDVAALAIKGPAAHLNFPDLVHLLPRAASAEPKDVQAAAALAAAMDFPGDTNGKNPDNTSDTLAVLPQPPPPHDETGLEGMLLDLPNLILDMRFDSPSDIPCDSSWVADDNIYVDDAFNLEDLMLWD